MCRHRWSLPIVLLAVLAGASEVLAVERRVCVEVVVPKPTATPTPGATGTVPPAPGASGTAAAATPGPGAGATAGSPTPASAAATTADADVLPGLERETPATRGQPVPPSLPIGQRPVSYLKRLVEHFVTHEKGFVAVQDNCEETLVVELYPLRVGWTVFARYSGTGREERVDQLLPTELSQFAERAALALLHGAPISATINRENVLTSDSKIYAQRIKGTKHFHMGVGTQVRVGKLGTTNTDSKSPDVGNASSKYRVATPVTMFLGYRGKFENWGVETNVFVGVGTSKTAASKNPGGGHVDFGGDVALQLHFLHYFDPRGLTSFFMGAGATFEFEWFTVVKAAVDRGGSDRSTLLGGGLDVDCVFGWEFMRASSVQFYLQGELQVPAYALSYENSDGGIHTWFPALGIKLGVLF